MLAKMAQFDSCPTDEQEFAGLISTGSGNIL